MASTKAGSSSRALSLALERDESRWKPCCERSSSRDKSRDRSPRGALVITAAKLPDGRQPLVRPGKLLKMIVWRGGSRSDRASHRTLRPVKLLEMIVWHGGSIKPRIRLRVAYEVRAARQQTVRSPRTMYPHSQEWHQNR